MQTVWSSTTRNKNLFKIDYFRELVLLIYLETTFFLAWSFLFYLENCFARGFCSGSFPRQKNSSPGHGSNCYCRSTLMGFPGKSFSKLQVSVLYSYTLIFKNRLVYQTKSISVQTYIRLVLELISVRTPCFQ